MVQFDDIDDVFREAAGEYQITPGDSAWRRIRRQILWRKLRYVIGFGIISVVALLMALYFSPGDEVNQAEGFPLLHTQVADNPVAAGSDVAPDPKPQADKLVVANHLSAGVRGSSSKAVVSRPVAQGITGKIAPMGPEAARHEVGVVSPMTGLRGLLSVTVQVPPMESRKVGEALLKPERDSAAIRWSADLFTGFSFSQFAGFSGGLPGHQELRDDGSWLLAPVAGAGFRLSKKGWFTSAGLSWNRVGQKVNFDVETTDLDNKLSHYDYDTTWIWIYDPPYYGEPFPASVDSTFIPIYQRQQFRGTLATDYLTIPLLFGYEYRSAPLALSAGAGFSFSIPVAWHGESPRGGLNGLVGASYELSHQIDIGLLMRMEASARIASRYWLFFRPVARFGLTNHSGSQSSLLYRNNSMGLDVGVRIDFNP